MSIPDPDDFIERTEEIAELDSLLAKLLDCDLSDWDQDFVDDLTKRVDKGTIKTVTPRQWEQLERMKGQYNVKED